VLQAIAQSGEVDIVGQTESRKVVFSSTQKKSQRRKDRKRVQKIKEHFEQVAPEILFGSAKSTRQYEAMRKMISLEKGCFSPSFLLWSHLLSLSLTDQDPDATRRSRIRLGEIPFPMMPTAATIKAQVDVGNVELLPPKEHQILVPDGEHPCLRWAERIVIASLPDDSIDPTPLVEEAREHFGQCEIFVCVTLNRRSLDRILTILSHVGSRRDLQSSGLSLTAWWMSRRPSKKAG